MGFKFRAKKKNWSHWKHRIRRQEREPPHCAYRSPGRIRPEQTRNYSDRLARKFEFRTA